MKRVYKYEVPFNAKKFSLPIPLGATFVRLTWQRDKLMSWFEVPQETPPSTMNFELFGTGQDIPDTFKYFATFEVGPLVMHMYQVFK